MNLRSLIQDIRAKEPVLCRAATLSRVKGEDGKESEDTFELSFSSEEPYERYFGVEILGHKKTEVKMDWIKGGSAPLLLEHNRSQQIGVVDKATLADGRATAVVRFGKTELAKGILADVVAGIRKNVSVGYEVNDMILIKQGKDGESSTYRVTDWKPLEISIVSLPADPTVGVGRGRELPLPTTTPPKEETMTPEEIAKKEADAKKAGQEAERKRATEIKDLCTQYQVPEIADDHIKAGDEPAKVKEAILAAVFAKAKSPGPAQGGPGVHTGQAVGGHSAADKKAFAKYSFRKAIYELSNGMGLTGLEKEMNEHGQKQAAAFGQEIRGIAVPEEIITRADLTVADDGANLVATDVMTDFIGALRNRIILATLGARYLSGLRGNVSFPKLSAGASATWEGENDANAESEPTTGKLTLTPKRVGLYSDISKQLLLQSSPDVERMLRDDLATALAVAIDTAGIAGTGSGGQPTGITATSGIGSVAGGANGLAPTWAHIVALESAVGVANADVGKLHYLTNAAVRGKLKSTAKVSSTDSRMIWDNDNLLNGYVPGITNSVPSNLTKGSSSGVCSAILFGNFDDLIIAQFGGLDLVVDGVTLATTGMVRVVANTFADVGVRRAASFAAMLDALTA